MSEQDVALARNLAEAAADGQSLNIAEREDALDSVVISIDEEWRAESLGLDSGLQLGCRGRVHRTLDAHRDADLTWVDRSRPLVIDTAGATRDVPPMTASPISKPRRGRGVPALAAAGVLFVVGAGNCAGPATGPSTRSAHPSPQGFVTYRLATGHVYELSVRAGARALDVSAALDRLSPGGRDEWLNTSPNGRWLLMGTERFGCGGWACLARVDATLHTGAAISVSGRPLHPDAFGAISSDGRTVVYPQGGGPHVRDLWVTRLIAGRWTTPVLITSASPQRYNMQPAISSDGRQVLFDCGPGVPEVAGTAICSVSTRGGRVRLAIGPRDGPGGTAHNLVHHAAFGASGAVVFEADWRGEQIWRLSPGSRRPLLVSRVHDDNSPCVLPDGKIASIYFDRPGNRSGIGELRIADPDGGHGAEILTGRDVADIGIGCGGDAPPAGLRATRAERSRASRTARIADPGRLGGHPRIFLDPRTLARLRSRARAGDPSWLALRTRCNGYRAGAVQWPDGDQYPATGGIGAGYQGDGYYPALLDVALCYEVALGLDPAAAATYARVGVAVLEHMSAPHGPHAPDTLRDSGYGVRYYATSMSIGYDWLYPALGAPLRKRVATAIERWVGDFERAGFEREFPQGNYFAGYYAAKAYAGIALSGDTAGGATLLADWRDRIQSGLVQPYYAANLAGGGWPEGWNYGPVASLNMSLPVLAARTALGLDLIHAPRQPYVYPLTNPRFILYFTWPSMTTLEDSSALYSGANPSVAAPWLFTTEAGLISALHDPFAQFFHSYARAARRAQPGGQLGADWDLWENLLFWDDSAPERPYKTLPLSYSRRGSKWQPFGRTGAAARYGLPSSRVLTSTSRTTERSTSTRARWRSSTASGRCWSTPTVRCCVTPPAPATAAATTSRSTTICSRTPADVTSSTCSTPIGRRRPGRAIAYGVQVRAPTSVGSRIVARMR